MNRRYLPLAVLPSPLVFLQWALLEWCDPIARILPLPVNYAIALAMCVVTFYIGPMAGLGAFGCCDLLLRRGWRSAWYAIPGMLLGATAFLANAYIFIYLLA